jgi:hypothetical protein
MTSDPKNPVAPDIPRRSPVLWCHAMKGALHAVTSNHDHEAELARDVLAKPDDRLLEAEPVEDGGLISKVSDRVSLTICLMSVEMSSSRAWCSPGKTCLR